MLWQQSLKIQKTKNAEEGLPRGKECRTPLPARWPLELIS